MKLLMLWLSSWIARNWLNVGFYVDGFWRAFSGRDLWVREREAPPSDQLAVS